MKATSFLFCAVVVVVAADTVAVTARQAGQKSDAGVVATLSVTGCLERWAPEPGAAADAGAAKPPAGVEFMLTRLQGQATSATGETGTPQTPSRHTRYLLLAAKGIDFAAHLNHRVMVTGTIAPQPSAGASAAQQAVDPSSRETNLPARPEAESYDGNLVDVSALKMVSNACGA